jgi:hypothetical protein
MSTKAGQIIISIRAGTSKLQTDLNSAKASFQEFGHHSVSSVQATSGALRVLEGNFTNNLRASERFIANTLRLGPILQSAFPLIGGLAFGGMLFEIGEKLHNFFKEAQEGPEKARGAFNSLNTSLMLTNDTLAVSNVRLQNDIDKLQGKPVNNLKVALLEAVEAADQLKKSLDGDLSSLYKLISEKQNTTWTKITNALGGKGTLTDVQKRIGGETGEGGANQDFSYLMDSGIEKIQSAKTLEESKAAQEELRARIQREYAALLETLQAKKTDFLQRESQQGTGFASSIPGAMGYTNPNKPLVDESHNLESITADIRLAEEHRQEALAKIDNAQLTQKRDVLQADADNAKRENPLKNRLAELSAQLDAVRLKFFAIGQTEFFKTQAAGSETAIKAIAEVNKALEKYHTVLTLAQQDQIHSATYQIALAEAEEQWKAKFTQSTDALKDRIQEQERLNAAIGGSYTQRRAAFVENGIAQEVGAANYNDPEFMRKHAAQVDQLRGQRGQEFDTQESGKTTTELQQLSDKIRLTAALAAAELSGADATRQAELAEKIRVATRGQDAAATARLTAALTQEDAAERLLASNKELKVLQDQAVAMDRLANAYGRQARLQAEAQNAYDKAINAGKTPEVAQAEKGAVLQKDQDEVLTKANELATAYSDQLQTIQRTEDALKNIAKIHGDTTAI